MSDVYTEPVSVRVTNPNLNVGVLTVPDNHPKVLLFDDKKASREVSQFNRDVYDVQQHSTPTKNRKIPKGVIFLLSASFMAGVVWFVKHFVKK